jgi:hypothetical protein
MGMKTARFLPKALRILSKMSLDGGLIVISVLLFVKSHQFLKLLPVLHRRLSLTQQQFNPPDRHLPAVEPIRLDSTNNKTPSRCRSLMAPSKFHIFALQNKK